jgi:membrane-anchored mycosin MYCP
VWRLWALVLLGGPVPVAAPAGCARPAVPVVVNPYPVARLAPLATGAGVRVAVVDSGVDGAGGQVVAGRDLLRGEAAGRRDCVGHGTAVAGAVSSVAPGVSIVPVRVAEGDPGDAAGVARVADGIRWAAGPGRAQVINISLVVAADDRRLRSAVAFAVGRGVVVVAAVGNDPAGGVRFPAAYPGVIGVGAILASGEPASFSPAGPEVDLVAAGDGGTSFAAGFVSGAAALVRERFPAASPAQVTRRLVATADRSRRLNPYRALVEADPVSRPPVAAAAAPQTPSRYADSSAPARRRALWFSGVALALAAAAGLAGVAVARARRRGWRPAK